MKENARISVINAANSECYVLIPDVFLVPAGREFRLDKDLFETSLQRAAVALMDEKGRAEQMAFARENIDAMRGLTAAINRLLEAQTKKKGD